jgi:hypothetical protein
MATTTNYSWTTPDDTALVKDGAAAIRSLGTAIDSTVFTNAGAAVAKATVDAKGDLIVGTADNTVARLAVGGTNGHVLTVDSGETTGLKYAAVPAASKSFSLLNAGGTSLSGSTTTISGISNQDQLFILVSGASLTAQGRVRVRFNSDTGSNYTWYGARKEVTSATGNPSTDSASSSTDSLFESLFLFAAATTGSFGMTVSGAATSGVKMVDQVGGISASAGAEAYDIKGVWNNSATITSISIITAGTFDAGTVYVYGAS